MYGGASLIQATSLTRNAVRGTVGVILLSSYYLLIQYPELPPELPVHFTWNGRPNGWQYRTIARVLIPVLVQLALTLSLGAIAALLLSRSRRDHDLRTPEVRAAQAAAEAVTLIAFIWVAFQGYAAYALVSMWMAGRGGLGSGYVALQLGGLVLTGVVAARAHARVGRPDPKPFEPSHWWLGQLYHNPDDPALFVPTRSGDRWTLNFGRPVAAALLAVVLLLGIIAPTTLLALALR
jgi:uncharacterized membrane protein